MKIDKMDQTAGIVPTLWSLMSTTLMKQGSRLQVSMNGSQWHGTRNTSHHITTMFEDCPHGAEMQLSTIIMNLHRTAVKEGSLPEEWVIGADNTPKETKNQYMIYFMAWLLCISSTLGWPLWSILLVCLLVGQR